MATSLSLAERELVVTRLFNFPRPIVYKTWIDPRLALRWWGPEDYPANHTQIDLRPGGAWSARFRTREDGRELRTTGLIQEITPLVRLMFTLAWEENGERGLDTLVTVAFDAVGNSATRITIHQRPFKSREERDDYMTSWLATFDRFGSCLNSIYGKSNIAGDPLNEPLVQRRA